MDKGKDINLFVGPTASAPSLLTVSDLLILLASIKLYQAYRPSSTSFTFITFTLVISVQLSYRATYMDTVGLGLMYDESWLKIV